MVGIHYEELKIRQQEIEVQALVALAAYGSSSQKYNACRKLEDFAHPERLANKINQQIAQKQLELAETIE